MYAEFSHFEYFNLALFRNCQFLAVKLLKMKRKQKTKYGGNVDSFKSAPLVPLSLRYL